MKLNAIQENPQKVRELIRDEDALTLTEREEKVRPSLETVRKLSDWVNKYNSDLRKSLDARDVHMTRMHLIALIGAANQMNEHIQNIAKEMGLPDLEA
jgi:hypothetical protein